MRGFVSRAEYWATASRETPGYAPSTVRYERKVAFLNEVISLWLSDIKSRQVVFRSDNVKLVHKINNISAESVPVVRLLEVLV